MVHNGYIETLHQILTPWHYQRCRPGVTEFSILADLKSAYMQVADRIESPLVKLLVTGSVYQLSAPTDLARKWRDLKDFLRGDKELYTRFVGCAAAGIEHSGVQWFKLPKDGNEAISCPSPIRGISSLASFGALVIRVCGEVTQLQALALKSRYANIDSVTADGEYLENHAGRLDADPTYRCPGVFQVWNRLGLDYSIKAWGPGHYIARGAYRIGEAPFWNDQGKGFKDAEFTQPVPGTHKSLSYDLWNRMRDTHSRPKREIFPGSDESGAVYSHTRFHEFLFGGRG